MPVRKLKEFLKREGIRYTSIYHSLAYTSQEVAALVHIPGKDLAKTVMVKLDEKMAMAVLPASHQIELELLRVAAGAREVHLATEEEFRDLFPECEIGAMPPFGNLYGMEVYVAPALAEDQAIAFNAGSHHELLKLAYEDFVRLVHPRVAKFSRKTSRNLRTRTTPKTVPPLW